MSTFLFLLLLFADVSYGSIGITMPESSLRDTVKLDSLLNYSVACFTRCKVESIELNNSITVNILLPKWANGCAILYSKRRKYRRRLIDSLRNEGIQVGWLVYALVSTHRPVNNVSIKYHSPDKDGLCEFMVPVWFDPGKFRCCK